MTREEAIRIEVVRCQDCKHCDISLVLPSGRKMYTCMEGTHDHQMLLSPNDFCSYGERRKQDVNKYGVEPYIDIGGNGEDHATCEWISLKDRLPEDQEEVLVCTRSKNGIRNIDMGYMAFDRFIHRGYAEVTHWMPLPHPPKEEARAITSVLRRK